MPGGIQEQIQATGVQTMARKKIPYKARVYSVNSSLFTEPISEVEGAWHGKVPVIEALMPDGRQVFLTFELPVSTRATPRGIYTRRMRLLGQALMAEADRRDADPGRLRTCLAFLLSSATATSRQTGNRSAGKWPYSRRVSSGECTRGSRCPVRQEPAGYLRCVPASAVGRQRLACPG